MDKYIIGIDVGGSKIITALVKGGKVFYKIKIETPKNKNEFLKKLETMIEQLIEKAGERKNIKGIGLAILGVSDFKSGMTLMADNLRILNNFNLKDWVAKKFRFKVRIDNDSRSFTRAEYLFGVGKGFKNIIGITLGTGVGGGIIIDGKVFHGSFNSAGEIGHMIYNKTEFEDLMSAQSLKKIGFSDSLAIYKFAKVGNKKARKIFRQLGEYLGVGLANLVNILDPEAIVIGGGMAGASKFFLPEAKRSATRFILSPKSRKNVKILVGKLGEDAGAIGAAALF